MNGQCTICRRGFEPKRPLVNFFVGDGEAHAICRDCSRMPDASIRSAISLRIQQAKEPRK